MKNPLTLLNRFSGKAKANMVFIIVIFLIIWFIFPLISIGNSQPFASVGVRILLLAIVLCVYGAKFFVEFFLKHQEKALPSIVSKLRSFGRSTKSHSVHVWKYSKIKVADAKDKVKRGHKNRRLRKLPWYLVLGASQSGKRNIIKNSGLMFVKPDYLGEEAISYTNQFPDFEWWFSEKGVMIDSMTYDREKDTAGWKKFVKLLKRERSSKPLNGVIITFSIADLILYTNKQRQEFLQETCAYIRDINDAFKSLVPVYLVFNKCDQVEGFMEFFDTLSREELSQVWGMTLPIANCSDLTAVRNFFNLEYKSLVEQLYKRVMWGFDAERSIRGRELINAFPQQMQLLSKPIENFIVELFGAVRYRKALQFRGVYFTSCIQGEGKVHDFLLQAMSKKFQLVPPRFESLSRVGECYFVRSLFFGVVLPEAALLGDSERSKRIKKIAYKSFLMACPLLIVSMFMGMHYGHAENVDNLEQIARNIDDYNGIVASLKEGDNNLLPLLPALNKLTQSRDLYTKSDQWGLRFLFASYKIKSALNQTLQDSLHSLFLPRIAAQIEDDMNHNIIDQNLLYATLKGYLAFSASNYSNQYSIKAPVEYSWNKTFIKNPGVVSKLKDYLNISMHRNIEKLPLDKNLINRIRSQLAQVDPSQRAYGLLSLRASVVNNAPDIIIPTAVEHFSTLFDSSSELKVPALYTQKGFENIFLKQYRPVTSEVAEDNKAIGLSNNAKENETVGQLRVNVEHMYNSNYIKTWNSTLANIKVKPFNNLDDAINVLNTIIGKQSPMPQLLNVIYNNTYDINGNNVNVEKEFSSVNHYISKGSGQPSWNETATILSKLHDYMVTLQKSPDQNKACFDAAEKVIQDSKNDPLQQLTVMAQASPQPLKRWMLSLADNCWGVIVTGAHQYMNSAWQNTVFTNYSAGIKNRYPIKKNANANISIADFNSFFSKGGSLDVYFNSYIKPFMNTDQKTWKLYTVNNRTIEFPQSTIDVFQKAQKISNAFFPHGSKQATIDMVIKPLTLSNNATSIKFKAGSNELNYSHGPQYVSHWSWPLSSDSDDASIILTTFNGEQYSHYSSGPWSMFQMFSHGVFSNTSANGTHIFKVNLHGFVASYLISGPEDVNVFKLTRLMGFVLHDQIVPVTRGKKK